MKAGDIYLFTAPEDERDGHSLHLHTFRLTKEVELDRSPGSGKVKAWKSVDVETGEEHHWTEDALKAALKKA